MTLMESRPVSLSDALASFGDIYSPRIVGHVNDYDIRVAHVKGEHVWHVHDHTDEFFLVLSGQFDVSLRGPGGGERTVTLTKGEIFVVPKGTEHKPSSPGRGNHDVRTLGHLDDRRPPRRRHPAPRGQHHRPRAELNQQKKRRRRRRTAAIRQELRDRTRRGAPAQAVRGQGPLRQEGRADLPCCASAS